MLSCTRNRQKLPCTVTKSSDSPTSTTLWCWHRANLEFCLPALSPSPLILGEPHQSFPGWAFPVITTTLRLSLQKHLLCFNITIRMAYSSPGSIPKQDPATSQFLKPLSHSWILLSIFSSSSSSSFPVKNLINHNSSSHGTTPGSHVQLPTWQTVPLRCLMGISSLVCPKLNSWGPQLNKW